MNKANFKPHMMYDPKSGRGVRAKTYAEHLALKKKGYGHTKTYAEHLALKKKGYGHSKPKSNQTASAIEERMKRKGGGY
jgi:hypothetical protein